MITSSFGTAFLEQNFTQITNCGLENKRKSNVPQADDGVKWSAIWNPLMLRIRKDPPLILQWDYNTYVAFNFLVHQAPPRRYPRNITPNFSSDSEYPYPSEILTQVTSPWANCLKASDPGHHHQTLLPPGEVTFHKKLRSHLGVITIHKDKCLGIPA